MSRDDGSVGQDHHHFPGVGAGPSPDESQGVAVVDLEIRAALEVRHDFKCPMAPGPQSLFQLLELTPESVQIHAIQFHRPEVGAGHAKGTVMSGVMSLGHSRRNEVQVREDE
jgi:hypothetical protein